jgi:integration host factor subunit beta
MIKSQLVRTLARANPDLPLHDAEKIVATIFHELAAALTRGDRVELRGFGVFALKRQAPRVGRNPRTGEEVQVAEKHVPFFRTGKPLQARLNGKGPPAT